MSAGHLLLIPVMIIAPLAICVALVLLLHFAGLILHNGETKLAIHRKGAVATWAILSASYLTEMSWSVQKVLVHNGVSAPTSHHIFGLMLIGVAVVSAGLIHLLSQDASESS